MITLDQVRAAVAIDNFDSAAAHRRMFPGTRLETAIKNEGSRQAGVLTLMYPQSDGFHIILTRRTETLRGHSGQISFPGGRRDPTDESFTATALRETCEELGVCEGITVIGQLSPIYIPPSNFEVFPTIGVMESTPIFHPNPAEVAEVFTVLIDDLLDERYKALEYREFQGRRVPVPYYSVHGHKVWGATAIMLSELEERLRAVLPQETVKDHED
jgi:8-oxo-dGTP pyrophosphatase MutT (NUDIX family)